MLEGPDDPAGTDGGSKDGNASQLTNNTFLEKDSSGYGTVCVCVCVSDLVASPSGALGIAALSCVRRREWSRDSPWKRVCSSSGRLNALRWGLFIYPFCFHLWI
ncbi:trans-sialidase [Trypanosoma cruzi]|nr:trans-sialidase [Trypanosoma cruzi]